MYSIWCTIDNINRGCWPSDKKNALGSFNIFANTELSSYGLLVKLDKRNLELGPIAETDYNACRLLNEFFFLLRYSEKDPIK